MSQSAAIARAAADLAPISLGELEQEAALMTRTDRKYLVPLPVASRLLTALADDLRVLEIAGTRSSRYRSTYFETDGRESFRTAATGRRRRFKVRTRTYVESGTSFLEVKTLSARGQSSKVRRQIAARSRLGGAQVTSLGGDELTFVHQHLDAVGVPRPEGALQGRLSTSYSRTTLLVPSEGSRLTIDADLRWESPHLPGISPTDAVSAPKTTHLQQLVVVETKSGARPGLADRFLWSQGQRPRRLSKYATGLALLTPDLPANRWHRTLELVRSDAA
ncbi:VTC domain-containing protein [Ornithinimicrobium sp. Y1694]|uniref:VTC domain-containing protein n=1 Tax=Ornithinimicrobium sp. Y1694 TaxID=3418590 RepID=UPI003CF08578